MSEATRARMANGVVWHPGNGRRGGRARVRRHVGSGMASGCLAHFLHAGTTVKALPGLSFLGVSRGLRGAGCGPVLDTLGRHLGNPLRLEGLF